MFSCGHCRSTKRSTCWSTCWAIQSLFRAKSEATLGVGQFHWKSFRILSSYLKSDRKSNASKVEHLKLENCLSKNSKCPKWTFETRNKFCRKLFLTENSQPSCVLSVVISQFESVTDHPRTQIVAETGWSLQMSHRSAISSSTLPTFSLVLLASRTLFRSPPLCSSRTLWPALASVYPLWLSVRHPRGSRWCWRRAVRKREHN